MYHQRMRSLVPLCASAMLVAACGGRNAPDTPMPQPGPGVEQITGRERIGWEQPASTAGDLAGVRYLIYVDGNAGVELQSVQCGDAPGTTGFPCSAALPPLSAGAHALALSSYIDTGSRIESPRSPTLSVFVTGRLAGATAGTSLGAALTTSDGVSLHAEAIAIGLNDPTDMVVLPDGRFLIAERAGVIRIVAANALQTTPVVTLDDVATGGEQGLLALAPDPEFPANGYVYAAYNAHRGLRLARFRAIGNRLYDRVVLVDGAATPVDVPATALRFGPDGRLYWGIDDGGDAAAAGDLGTFSGKVLRLSRDGTTPADQPAGSPVYARALRAPRGLDWDADGAMWVLDAPDSGSTIHRIVRDAPGRAAMVTARYSFPGDVMPRDLLVYTGEALPAFRGDLFVADDGGASLVRLRHDHTREAKIVAAERLLEGRITSARAVAAGKDGALYLATADALLRIGPDAPR
jgi:glucose/arabinose dehydrogenase